MPAPATRERQERFAKSFDGVRGLDWSASVDRFLRRVGLFWLTDEQMEEVTADMVSHARFSQRLRVLNRQACAKPPLPRRIQTETAQ